MVKSVYLLEQSDVPDEENSLLDETILINSHCELLPSFTEKEIREELVSLFKTKFPYITDLDFNFVKRERNTISKPILKENYRWDFKNLKSLWKWASVCQAECE